MEDLQLAVHGDVDAAARMRGMLESGYGSKQANEEATEQFLRQAW